MLRVCIVRVDCQSRGEESGCLLSGLIARVLSGFGMRGQNPGDDGQELGLW